MQLTLLIVQRISTEAIHGIVALGLVLCYPPAEVLNFAQGDLMLSAFLGWGLVVAAGPHFCISFLFVLAFRWGIASSSKRRSCEGSPGGPISRRPYSPSESAS